MSSASKGKRYERKLCNRLRENGYKAERIRGSGGGTGTRSADVLFCDEDVFPADHHAYETRGTDKQGLTIERAFESGKLESDHIYDAEVKYDSSGFSRLYTEMWKHGVDAGSATHLWLSDEGRIFASFGIDDFFDWFSRYSVSAMAQTLVPDIVVDDGVKVFSEPPCTNSPTNRLVNDMRAPGTAKPPDFLFARRSGDTLGPVDFICVFDVGNYIQLPEGFPSIKESQ